MRTMRTTSLFFPKLLSTLALMLASISASASTDARTNATFSIENLRYDLTDLDPYDGITPALTFTIDPNARWHNTIVRAFGHFGEIARDYSPTQPAGTPSSVGLSFPFGSVTASMTGAPDANLSLQGGAIFTVADGVERNMSMRADSGALNFMLSPMTAVTWRSDIAAHGATVLPMEPAAGGLASLSLSMSVYSQLLAESAPLRAFQQLTALPGERFDFQDTFELTLSNTLMNEAESVLNLNGSGYLVNAMSPVPEPAGWAMLLAGAAVVSPLARRRRPAPGTEFTQV